MQNQYFPAKEVKFILHAQFYTYKEFKKTQCGHM